MKIAILADTHFGARNDSQLFLDYFTNFFENTFFPECEKRGVKTIIHLGDLMDRRKFVNFNTLSQMRERFVQPIVDGGYDFHCIVGNHDTYFKNTNDVNSPMELFGGRYDNIHIYDEPVSLTLGGCKFAMVPWINKENESKCLDFIANSTAKILCAHLELDGYQVMRGIDHVGGYDASSLSHFDKVWTGHFHVEHKKDNIHYVGTAYQMTFSDLFEKKGFYIYDTETDDMEFVENPDRRFHSIQYTDDTDYTMVDFRKFRGSYVKVFVHEKKNAARFDKLIERLYDSRAESVMILENETQKQESKPVDEGTLATDTLTLIGEQIDDIHSNDKDEAERLKNLFKELYLESFDEN